MLGLGEKKEKRKMIFIVITLLGVGCAYLGLGMLVDRLLVQPVERRWRR